MNAEQLKHTLSVAFKNFHPLIIVSEPGNGKTDIIKEMSESDGYDFIPMHPAVGENTDVKGFPWCMAVDGKITADFVTYGEMDRMITATRPTVVLWDDLGHADDSMQKAIMHPIWAREINGKKISKHVRFVAATNDIKHKAGVSGIIEPLKSRFKSIVRYKPTTEDWCKWAHQHGQPPKLISFIRTKPTSLTEFEPTKELKNSPCPRTVAGFGEIIKAEYGDAMTYELGEGAVGTKFVTDYVAWEKVYQRIPDPELVLKDPKGVKLPDEKDPGLIYALCDGVVSKVTQKNIGQAIEFLERIPKEFGVMFMKCLYAADRKIGDTKAFTDWCVDNHVLFGVK